MINRLQRGESLYEIRSCPDWFCVLNAHAFGFYRDTRMNPAYRINTFKNRPAVICRQCAKLIGASPMTK